MRHPLKRRHLLLAGFTAVVALLTIAVKTFAVDTSFTLEERDKIIAEDPACYATCKTVSPGRRLCTFKDPTCHAVCQAIPECAQPGQKPLRACAIMKKRTF